MEPWVIESDQDRINRERAELARKVVEESNARIELEQLQLAAQYEREREQERQERADREAAAAAEIVRQEQERDAQAQAQAAQLSKEAKSALVRVAIAKIVDPIAGAFVRKKANIMALNESIERYLKELSNFTIKYYDANRDKPNGGKFSLKRSGIEGSKNENIRRLYVIAYVLQKLVATLDDRILPEIKKDQIKATIKDFSNVFALETRDFFKYFDSFIMDHGSTKELMRRISAVS